MHHSDRRVRYLSIKYSERLAGAGIDPSVGNVGDSCDNALAETINGLYKAEATHPARPVEIIPGRRMRHPRMGGWFNNNRLLSPIGNIPPAEAEANHYAAGENLDMAT